MRALEREAARAAGLRMVVDVSNLNMHDQLEEMLQHHHVLVYDPQTAVKAVSMANWKSEYPAPIIPKDVC